MQGALRWYRIVLVIKFSPITSITSTVTRQWYIPVSAVKFLHYYILYHIIILCIYPPICVPDKDIIYEREKIVYESYTPFGSAKIIESETCPEPHSALTYIRARLLSISYCSMCILFCYSIGFFLRANTLYGGYYPAIFVYVFDSFPRS